MRLLLVASLFSCADLSPPHIVTIVVDDLGWGDVPWNNPESPAVHLGRGAPNDVSGCIFRGAIIADTPLRE